MSHDVEVNVVHAAGRDRYEARGRDGAMLGHADYSLSPGVVVLTHTEVDDDLEGEGVGSRLVAGALDDVRARGLGVVARCPFVRAYVERHPEYADLLTERSSSR